MKTPLRQDTRLWLTVYVITVVFVLVAMGKEPNEQVLTFLGLTLAAFLGQSQLGQTVRAKAQIKAQAQQPQEPTP